MPDGKRIYIPLLERRQPPPPEPTGQLPRFTPEVTSQGRTLSAEELLSMAGFGVSTEPETAATARVTPATMPTPDIREKQGDWGYVLGALQRGGSNFLHGTKQFFTAELPMMISSYVTAAGEPPKEVSMAGAWDERAKRLRQEGLQLKQENYELAKAALPKLQEKYQKQEAEHQKAIESNPNLKPHPEWNRPAVELIKEKPSTLKNPAYWAYLFSESAAYSMSFMGTTIAVTAATGNPYLGAAAGVAATSPAQISDVYNDLIENGATPEQASMVAPPIGTLISSIEIVGGFPVLKALLPQFSQILTRQAKKEIVKLTMKALLAKGIKTFGLTEITETLEEVTQQAVQDATVKVFNENRDMLANLPETVIRTLIATVPWAAVGGGAEIVRGGKPAAEAPAPTKRPPLSSEGGFVRLMGEEPEGEAVQAGRMELIPKAAPGEPEAGLQPEMFGRPPTEVRPTGKGRVTQISMDEQVRLEQARTQAELEGLRETVSAEPASELTYLIKTSGKMKGEFPNLTIKQYKDLTRRESVPENILTPDKKHVRWEYALDTLASERGYADGDALREGIMRSWEAKQRIKELESEVARVPQPTPKAPETGVTPAEAVKPTIAPEQPAVVPEKAVAPETLNTPQGATQKVENTIEKAKANPKQVKSEDADFAFIEQAAPDGPQPPKKPPVTSEGMPPPQRPEKPLSEILGNAPQGERPDQTLLRIHEAARNTITRQTNIVIQKGSQKLKGLGIGATKRGQLVPREQDKEKLLELYNALHNPSKVESGEIAIPEGFDVIYNELRGLADWDTTSRIDFDPKAAVIDDWFFRGWKPPEGMFATTQKGRLGIKPKPLRMPRVNATFDEMIDLGFEPLFWNPYQQWGYRHNLGEIYREQMELIKWLKGMGEDFARPESGGILPAGWRVPRIGPAFEGKPFATTSIDGEPVVMYTRRWIVPDNVAQTLENIYGKRPNLGKVFIGKLEIDPLGVIDALTFIPKRAKLLFSLFQQVDFLTRAGAGSWSGAVDMLMAGKPISAVKSVIRYPKTVVEIIQSNLSPGKRLSLLKQLDDITPIIPTRKGINLKGISEQGLSTMDVTIFSEEMDKLMRSLPDRAGLWQKFKGIPSSLVDLESAMRRGLFNGVYPAAMITDIKNNIAPIIARQFPKATDTQINAMIAKIANIKYSTIPPAQSVIQNPVIRETLRRLFFSMGESEGLLRQAAGQFYGKNKAFWAKNSIGVYLFVIVMANIIHFMSTGKPLPKDRYSPVAKDNWSPLGFGYNTKFAAPTLPVRGRGDTEITLDLMGQMDTAWRVLDPWSFISARTNVPVRAAINQVSGTDFYGAPIDEVGPGGVASRTAAMALDLFAPIGAGGITTEALRQIQGAEELIPEGESRLGMAGLGIQATGLNLRTEWTGVFLDRKARESGMKKRDGSAVMSWADLEPNQKDKLLSDSALVKELAARRETSLERGMLGAAGFATLEALDEQRITRGESLVTEFERGDFDASTFRDEVGNLKTEIASRKSQVDEDFQLYKDTQELPEDLNKRALVQYYNLFDIAKRESGSIDWDKVEQMEVDLRQSWTPEQEAYVNDNIGLTEWGPKMQEYVDAQDALQASGYWDIEEPNQAQKRMFLRRANPRIDAILQKWYGYKSVTGGVPTPRTPVTSQPTREIYTPLLDRRK